MLADPEIRVEDVAAHLLVRWWLSQVIHGINRHSPLLLHICGLAGNDSITIEVMQVPDLPSITIDHPEGGEQGLDAAMRLWSAVMSTSASICLNIP